MSRSPFRSLVLELSILTEQSRRIDTSEEEGSSLRTSTKPSLSISITPWWPAQLSAIKDSFVAGLVLVAMIVRMGDLIGPARATVGQ